MSKIEYMITSTLILPDDIYLRYLGYIFPVDGNTGFYQVSARLDIGRLCAALAEEADGKPGHPRNQDKMKSVTLKLPKLIYTQSKENKWLTYSPESTKRIRDVLVARFHQDFIAYWLRGQMMGCQKKEIVEMFITSRRLGGELDPFDALHKRAYRLEQKRQQLLVDQLLRKARYFDETLDTKGLI